MCKRRGIRNQRKRGRLQLRHLDEDGLCCGAGSGAAYLVSNGYCNAAKMNVRGTTPNTLNATHTSVVCVRHTISLSTARTQKNNAQRTVSLRQPSSVRLKTESNTIPKSGLSNRSPPRRTPANKA